MTVSVILLFGPKGNFTLEQLGDGISQTGHIIIVTLLIGKVFSI